MSFPDAEMLQEPTDQREVLTSRDQMDWPSYSKSAFGNWQLRVKFFTFAWSNCSQVRHEQAGQSLH